jgi:hypothetical protein
MAWIAPTLDSCKRRIPKEWPSLSNAAKMQGDDADVIGQEVIATQVMRIRGRVPATVRRGEEGTIPDELQDAFFALWVYAFITKLPAMKNLLDQLRVSAWENANKELDALSSGKIHLVPPATAAPDAEQAAGPGIEVARPARVPQSFADLT